MCNSCLFVLLPWYNLLILILTWEHWNDTSNMMRILEPQSLWHRYWNQFGIRFSIEVFIVFSHGTLILFYSSKFYDYLHCSQEYYSYWTWFIDLYPVGYWYRFQQLLFHCTQLRNSSSNLRSVSVSDFGTIAISTTNNHIYWLNDDSWEFFFYNEI